MKNYVIAIAAFALGVAASNLPRVAPKQQEKRPAPTWHFQDRI